MEKEIEIIVSFDFSLEIIMTQKNIKKIDKTEWKKFFQSFAMNNEKGKTRETWDANEI